MASGRLTKLRPAASGAGDPEGEPRPATLHAAQRVGSEGASLELRGLVGLRTCLESPGRCTGGGEPLILGPTSCVCGAMWGLHAGVQGITQAAMLALARLCKTDIERCGVRS